jgi:hypothetical protein
MASGSDGTFIMAGEFLDEAIFGDVILNSSGGTDIFILRFSSGGDVLEGYQVGAGDYEFVRDVEMDGEGNIYLLGYFYGTTQIGSDLYTSYGSQDIFLAKMDDTGNVLWSQQIGGIMADYPSALSLDEYGNVMVAGYFYDEISLGDTSLVSQAGSDIYLVRYSMNGQMEDIFQAGGSSSDQLHSLTVDHDGNTVLTGSFYDDITMGDTTLSTADPVGVFIARIDPGFNLDWAFQLNGSYLNTESFARADHEGNFYLGGSFSEDIHFGSQTFSAGEFNQDVYLAKYDSGGGLLWARHGSGPASDQVTGLGVDDNNNVYMTGHFLDTLQFGQITIPYTLCCGSREVYIINYSYDGRPWWSDQISGARTSLHSMTMSASNQVLMSGQFTEEVILGPWTLSSMEGFVNYVTCLSGDIFTEIKNPDNTFSFSIYPNPSSDVIHIDSPGKIIKAEIFNILGASQSAWNGEDVKVLDVSGLPVGAYFLRIVNEKGISDVRKVVVVK